MNTLKQLKEVMLRNRALAGMKTGAADEIDHAAEISKIKTAMEKYPSNDEKIKSGQLARINLHQKMLQTNNK